MSEGITPPPGKLTWPEGSKASACTCALHEPPDSRPSIHCPLHGWQLVGSESRLGSDSVTPPDPEPGPYEPDVVPGSEEAQISRERRAAAGVPQHILGDGPPCQTCGAIMQRTGTCYTCPTCGSTSGCG